VDITVLRGDGSAFWARGMAEAERAALQHEAMGPDDLILWLNDDVELEAQAVNTLLNTANSEDVVVVGAMRDPRTGDITYSGLRRAGKHPLNFRRVTPGNEPIKVDTFNGNCVLVPARVARTLGGIDGGFAHALADIDYGLRCNKLGVPVLLASESVGLCARNPDPARTTTALAWDAFRSQKGGGNFPSLRRILRRTNPHTWWAFIALTYSLWWFRRFAKRS
jgi:GT2 family glycosyltransferase